MQEAKLEEKPSFEFSYDFYYDLGMWKTFSEYMDEALFTLTQEGLRVKGIDKAFVCLIEYFIPKEKLNDLKMNKEKIEFLLDLNTFNKAIQTLSFSAKLKLEDNYLWISDNTTKYRIPLLDNSSTEFPDISQLEWDTSIEINSNEFKDFIKKVEWIGDKVKFEIKDGKLIISCEGEFVKCEITKSVGLNQNLKASFPLDYLKKLKLSHNLKIWLKTDYPMKIENCISEQDKRKFALILAPRIEEDDVVVEEEKKDTEIEPTEVDEEIDNEIESNEEEIDNEEDYQNFL
jgi:DNA polymerase III sliding clamp (beta) subunit (PCNA family)